MDLRSRLEGLNHAALVEAVYLCGRYLSHGLTPGTFQHQLDVDVRTRYREQSAAAVLDVMSAIEAEEGALVAELSPAVRSTYVDQLSEYLWDRSEAATDAVDVGRALASMSDR